MGKGKGYIMRLSNALCAELEQCNDGEFVDLVINAVSCNEVFSNEEIIAAERRRKKIYEDGEWENY